MYSNDKQKINKPAYWQQQNRLFISIVASLLMLLLSSHVYAARPPLEKVKLQLKWTHAFQFAGYYAAKQQGYYADVGLEVQIIERTSGKPVVTEVMSGRADYGVEDAGILVQYANGSPIKALAAIFQHNPLIFISKQSSKISTPQDIAGKRVMMYNGQDGTEEAPLRALLYDAQLSTQQYTLVAQSFNDDDLISDKTDVISGYLTDQPFYYRNKGIKINIINPQSYGFDFYGDLLFTRQAELEQHPGRAQRFRDASLKGWYYALKHPEQIIQLIHQHYHAKSSLEHLRFEAKETRQLISANSTPIGQITIARLRRIATVYHELGLIKPLSDEALNHFLYDHPAHNLGLSKEELQWLRQHPIIRLGIDNNFAPYEWVDKHGHYVGRSADYMRLIEQRLGIQFEIIKDKPWADILVMAKQGKLDMIADAVDTPERREYLHFSQVYSSNPNIIINDASHNYIGSLKNLYHKTVAIEKSYSIQELLQQQHPEINLLPAANTAEALRMVAAGKADAYIGDAGTANYAISKTGLFNLRFSGQSGYLNQHRIGVIKSQPLLLSIINKTLNSISTAEHTKIDERWLSLHIIDTGVPTETLLKYAIAIVLLFLYFAYWVLRLRKEVHKRLKVETNLRKTESRFNESQQFAQFGIWEWDILSGSLFWSETVAPLFGYEAEGVQPNFQLFSNAIHPDDKKHVDDAIQACLQQSQNYDIEHRVVWPDHSIHWLHEVGNVVRDSDNKAIKMLGTVRDITRKKRIEDILLTLAESNADTDEDIFHLIARKIATSHDVEYALIAQVDDQNPGFAKTLAVWSGNKFLEKFSYSLKDSPCERVMQEGLCLFPDKVQKLFPTDHLLVDMQARSYVGIPLKNSANKVIGIIALLSKKPMQKEQINENLLSSLAVRVAIEIEQCNSLESLQIANLVYQSSHEAMLMIDKNNRIVAINPAFTEVTGYCANEILYKYLEQIPFSAEIWASISQTEHWQGELLIQHKNGTRHTIHMNINTIFDNAAEVYRRIALFTDITEQKQAEKSLQQFSEKLQQEVKQQTFALEQAIETAEHANLAKSEFLANMSHELRTPMHGIISFARFGIKNVETASVEKLAKYFDRINTSAERLLVLLNDLLDLSKLEAGKMLIEKTSCNIYQLVSHCIAEQEACLKDKQLTICWQESDNALHANVDAARITQVVTNLLSNAIKFSDVNRTLYFSIIASQWHNQAAFTFSLRDEGTGIPEQELEQVFDKFIQSSKTKSNSGGTGLGLAISKEIVEAHQGKIWAENAPQSGAIFFMLIPLSAIN